MIKFIGVMMIVMSTLTWGDGHSFYDEDRGAETDDIKTKYLSMYGACIEEQDGYRNASVAGCSYRVLEVVTAQINTLYTELHAKIVRNDAYKIPELQTSQQAWKLYKDNHCSLMLTYGGGPMENYCPMQMSIDRLVELQELSSNFIDE